MTGYVMRLYDATVVAGDVSLLPAARVALADEVARQVGGAVSPAALALTTTVRRCPDDCCLRLSAVGIAAAWHADPPRMLL